VYTHQKITGFEIKELKNPFETTQRLPFKKISETSYQVELPEKFSNKESRFRIVFDNYLEIGVKDFSKFFA
ncbi:glycosyltransferase family 2 protein, partial [Enterococcus faecalis]